MKYTEQDIDDFIQNRMPKARRKQFEEAIQNDPELAAEVAFYSRLQGGIQKVGREELRAELEAIHERKHHSPDSGKPNIFKKYWPWLLIGGLLLGTLLYLSYPISSSPQQLYVSYYEPYELNVSTRNENSERLLIEIESLYDSKKYSEAIAQMENYLSNQVADGNVQLALANAYMSLENYTAALNILETLELKNDVFLRDHVLWYKALVFLQAGNLPACQIALDKIISTPNSDHFEEATTLSSKLKKL